MRLKHYNLLRQFASCTATRSEIRSKKLLGYIQLLFLELKSLLVLVFFLYFCLLVFISTHLARDLLGLGPVQRVSLLLCHPSVLMKRDRSILVGL